MKIMCNGFVLPSVPHRDLNMACITCRLIDHNYMYLLANDSKGLKGVSGIILLHAVVKMVKVAQYPVCSIAQSTLHFTCPFRPVHSDTNSAALGSILAMQQLRGMTNHSHFLHCL